MIGRVSNRRRVDFGSSRNGAAAINSSRTDATELILDNADIT
jgi:hypothetical protein